MHKSLEDRLNIVAEDEVMIAALQELFNNRVETEKPKIEAGDNDRLLGEKYRAYEQARNILMQAFMDLEKYKTKKNKGKGFNKAL